MTWNPEDSDAWKEDEGRDSDWYLGYPWQLIAMYGGLEKFKRHCELIEEDRRRREDQKRRGLIPEECWLEDFNRENGLQ